jgi:hypothetical protein
MGAHRTSRLLVCLLLVCLLCVLCVFVVNPLHAHPVPRKAHDRTIIVHLTPEAVVVDYRVEVDDWTVVFVDLPAIDDRIDLEKLRKPKEFYDAFVEGYAPLFANNLTATLDGRPLKFTCVKKEHQLIDHLRCDFEFRAPWQLKEGSEHRFTFYEGNYELEPGRIALSLAPDVALQVTEKTEPDEALKNKPPIEYKPGDEARLRKAATTFTLAWARTPPAQSEPPSPTAEPSPSTPGSPSTWLGFAALLGLTVVLVALRSVRALVRGG